MKRIREREYLGLDIVLGREVLEKDNLHSLRFKVRLSFQFETKTIKYKYFYN